MNRRPLAIISILFIIGIVFAKFLPDSVIFFHVSAVILVFISLALTFSLKGRGNVANIFLLLAIVLFGTLAYLNSNQFSNTHISYFLEEETRKADIIGIIKTPALKRGPYFGKINSTYLFELEAIKRNGEWRRVKGVSQIRIQTEKDYAYGDRLLARGVIKRPRNDSYYRAYLERQNIFAIINTKEHDIIILSQDYKASPVLKRLYLLREKLKAQILEKMPLDSGAFLRAILLGDRSELPKDIQESFKKSGTMHILAISGLHIALIAFFIVTFLKLLRFRRGFYCTFTIVFLILFALLTLSRPSVVRAVVMACIFILGKLLGRKVDVYNSLGAAAIFILLWNPKDLFAVGFQLSFLAVLSILYFTPKFIKLTKQGTNFYIKKYIFTPIAVSVSAWLGTAPLIFYYFKIFTPIAIVANIFVIPALFLSLLAGMTFLLFGQVLFFGNALASFNNICGHIIFTLADFFASCPLNFTL